MDALERRIAADEATSQETTKTDDDGFAEQMNGTTQAQDIPKASAPESSKEGQEKCDDEPSLRRRNNSYATGYNVTVVRQRSSYFRLANMQESPAANIVQQSQVLARVSHPNIASIYGVYSYIDKLLVVTEHLDISLAQLDFQSYKTEEWEIATIVAEVLKGLTYMSSKDISCQDLTTASIRLSYGKRQISSSREPKVCASSTRNARPGGDDRSYDSSPLPSHIRRSEMVKGDAPALLEMPVLEEIIEAMTLPRYHHTSDDQRRLLVSYPAQYRILDGLAHLASIGPSTAPSVAPTFSLARRGYQDRWPGALPEVGVIRPGTRAEHKSFGEHNNGIDAEIHYT
ncbi:hypothetical protein V495_00100 [Pseudogymnoascus sp. VKM F-4514 (FW-929)]|nr:hypothetical protein V495_00100 [Pseudogymnoascus sp. VKM F-4514 (FW-929)]